jgi:TldD protein
VVRDPFAVSLDDKVDLLMRTDEAMSHIAQIRVRECSLEFCRELRHFASSEGARLDQTIIEAGGGMDATATSDDEVQTRSFPNSFGRHQVCAGWEAI